jgi:D-sorbitol dehydrogenase (acceptor)
MGRLQDKVCIITGAAGGQGQVAVDLFAREGAKVVASDVQEKGDKQIAKTVSEFPERVVYVSADVTREEDLQRIVKTAKDKFDRIDVLYNNHGAMVDGRLRDVEGGRRAARTLPGQRSQGVRHLF